MPNYAAADGMCLHYDVLGDGGPVVTLAGGAARHYPCIEQPAAFRRAVDEFLSRPPRT